MRILIMAGFRSRCRRVLANDIPNMVSASWLLFVVCQELTTRRAPVSTGFMTEHMTHLAMDLINQLLGRNMGRVGD